MYLPELRLKYTHKHQTDNSLVALVAFSLEHVDYILKQRQVGANMVFARILGRVFGCWRRKGKSLQGSIQSHDRKVAANETLSDSESQSVYSVYLIDPVSAVSEASESIAFDDCWSYAVSVELVRYHYYNIVNSPVDTYLL
jgi:hypothetical protein